MDFFSSEGYIGDFPMVWGLYLICWKLKRFVAALKQPFGTLASTDTKVEQCMYEVEICLY